MPTRLVLRRITKILSKEKTIKMSEDNQKSTGNDAPINEGTCCGSKNTHETQAEHTPSECCHTSEPCASTEQTQSNSTPVHEGNAMARSSNLRGRWKKPGVKEEKSVSGATSGPIGEISQDQLKETIAHQKTPEARSEHTHHTEHPRRPRQNRAERTERPATAHQNAIANVELGSAEIYEPSASRRSHESRSENSQENRPREDRPYRGSSETEDRRRSNESEVRTYDHRRQENREENPRENRGYERQNQNRCRDDRGAQSERDERPSPRIDPRSTGTDSRKRTNKGFFAFVSSFFIRLFGKSKKSSRPSRSGGRNNPLDNKRVQSGGRPTQNARFGNQNDGGMRSNNRRGGRGRSGGSNRGGRSE
jgi:hypothetical protein